MRLARSASSALIFLVIQLVAGCISAKHHATLGLPLDKGKAALIKPGVTSLDEILAWFGPPDFIIRGTQRLVDPRSIIAGYSASPIGDWREAVKPRVLSAPAGAVILMYNYIEMNGTTTLAGVNVLAGEGEVKVRAEELFVYLSEKDLRVTDIALRTSGQ